MSNSEPKLQSHCKRAMRLVGSAQLHSDIDIGFNLKAGHYQIYACAEHNCDQVNFVPQENSR